MRKITFLAVLLLAGSFVAAPVHAQQVGADDARIADAAQLEATVLGHERQADRTRAALQSLLERDDVKELAEDRGLDLDRAAAAASTLSDEEASAVAPLVERAEAAMRQGGTITIGVYTLIIILLILILVT